MTKNFKFHENWATCKLHTSKESWNYLETDFMMKKYDQRFTKIEKRQFLDFRAKNQADYIQLLTSILGQSDFPVSRFGLYSQNHLS